MIGYLFIVINVVVTNVLGLKVTKLIEMAHFIRDVDRARLSYYYSQFSIGYKLNGLLVSGYSKFINILIIDLDHIWIYTLFIIY